ncbi:hypothetical protein MXD62_33505 [Frankia sp. Mgl5]|uniref:hypothetical protein n=1 Tax=Frankia sp. Mgl5 TaxID=2933793 RepID=UPI00200D5AA7|nr:hypothetical protein [Frankia sp. Mgl5]MCK9931998.1 hypothetical protein [Frankia sp. Mgl5]
MSLSLAELHESSVQYCFDRALLMPIADWPAVRADPTVGQRIARHYHAAPVIDQRAVPAYRALRHEIKQQSAFLTGPPEKGGLGVRVITQAEEAYGDVDDLVADLCGAREVRVFGSTQSGQDHPFLTASELDRLHVLHDVFGHAVAAVGFDQHGSEAAWMRHAAMFGPLARRAMGSEIRGRTCALLYGHPARGVPKAKMALLPERYTEPRWEVWQ